jgi:hypothetical protein
MLTALTTDGMLMAQPEMEKTCKTLTANCTALQCSCRTVHRANLS